MKSVKGKNITRKERKCQEKLFQSLRQWPEQASLRQCSLMKTRRSDGVSKRMLPVYVGEGGSRDQDVQG